MAARGLTRRVVRQKRIFSRSVARAQWPGTIEFSCYFIPFSLKGPMLM
jgi:hypothetical protein